MNVSAALLAGVLGTVVMTMLMLMAPRMGMPKMDMTGMLGTMVVPPGGAAQALGAAMHVMMGAVLAIVYALLWSWGLGSPNWAGGVALGLAHGVVAAVMMPAITRMHPRKPESEGGAMAVVGILMGHLVFGLVVAWTYGALA
ncbi:MAG: hypothetical protein P1P87_03240, partial [Trueperaceae bacterium]|nr:hypothetical protein [Trueperaceae bacterium]